MTRLRGALDTSYAGTWFDNSTGRYHVAVASPTPPLTQNGEVSTAERALTDAGIPSDADVTTVSTSLDQLSVAQKHLDQSLGYLIARQELQTGPDVTRDVLDLSVSSSASAADVAVVKAAAANDGVPTSVVTRPANSFAIQTADNPAKCSFPNCGWMEGGVKIDNSYATCSAGYVAQANFAPYNFYVVTAGHCASPDPNWYWYPGGSRRLLGPMDAAVFSIYGDYARIRVAGGGVFAPESAIWGGNLYYPTYAVAWSVPGQFGCRTGEAEPIAQCGTVQESGQTISECGSSGCAVVAGEFLVNACANPGDSGGPFVLNYYAVGILSSVGNGTCSSGGGNTWYAEVMNAIYPSNLNVTISEQGS